MRIDIVSIFPDYLTPLRLALPGRAQASGLLDLRIHDLRDWTHDRHRTVDDSPAGGGAGMVMRPEPWGEALDALLEPDDGPDPGPVDLVVPTPAGRPFTQEVAAELSHADRLVVACGRYEGIDQRVLDHAATRTTVHELSLGDYVLNGGEAAALAIVEAVVRLLPGFVGNPESLREESHGADGLLEYPVYTRPATWRGLDVPPVLRGGDHAAIAAWRHEASLRRTAERRPDLLHPSRTVSVGDAELELRLAAPADAGEIWTLQLACWVTEALVNDTLAIPALHEDLDDVGRGLQEWTTWVVHAGDRLVGSVRGRLESDVWHVGRLMVAPDLRGRGLGRWLLGHVEQAAPAEARRFSLMTGAASEANLRMYHRAGYRLDRTRPPEAGVTYLSRLARPAPRRR